MGSQQSQQSSEWLCLDDVFMPCKNPDTNQGWSTLGVVWMPGKSLPCHSLWCKSSAAEINVVNNAAGTNSCFGGGYGSSLWRSISLTGIFSVRILKFKKNAVTLHFTFSRLVQQMRNPFLVWKLQSCRNPTRGNQQCFQIWLIERDHNHSHGPAHPWTFHTPRILLAFGGQEGSNTLGSKPHQIDHFS